MKKSILRIGVILLAGLGLSACGAVSTSEIFDEEFWASSPLRGDSSEAELGLAELGKGNYSVAEAHFHKALKRDKEDVHALLGLAVLYQNTGQETKARENYEAILAIRPDASKQFVVWNTANTRPVSEIASVNLALLQSGAVVAGMGQGAAGGGASSDVAGAPEVAAMMGRNRADGPPKAMAATGTEAPPVMTMLGAADVNIVDRFTTLRDLRDEGLITAEEYATRRQANLGALLPLTSPPPAAGMDRPVPSSEQISGRLRAIGRVLELRAMTIGQHASERSMIVDALMPAAPVSVANPGRPPEGLMEAADSVRRLEALQGEGLITSDEYARERAAIERAMQPEPPLRTAATSTEMKDTAAAGEKAMAKPTGPQPAVHLASYRSRKAADRGWAQLRRAHKDLLDGLSADISQINLGPGKGTFFRLKAGPLRDRGAAENVCRQLKSRRQYCEPSFMNAG